MCRPEKKLHDASHASASPVRTSVRLDDKRTPSRRETNHYLSISERSQAIQAAILLTALEKRCVSPNTSGRTTSRERWALRTNRKTSIFLASTPLLPSSLNHQHRTHGITTQHSNNRTHHSLRRLSFDPVSGLRTSTGLCSPLPTTGHPPVW